MINVCKNCGKEFKHRAKRVFCSAYCRSESKKLEIEYIDFTCEWCGQPFKRLRRHVVAAENKNQPIRFCSRKCKDASWGKNRKTYQCAYCGKDFIKNVNQSGICCSHECSEKLHKQNMVKRYCEYCGKMFTRKKSHMNLNNSHVSGRYCSRECSNNAKKKRKYLDYKCLECGKEFTATQNRHRVFCCGNCKKEWHKKQRVYLKCEICGKDFSVTKSRYKNSHSRFCSQECRLKGVKIQKDTYAKISHALRTSKNYIIWREKVLNSHNNTCQECGDKSNTLHAHHIKELYKICLEFKFDFDKILNSKIFNDVANGQCLCESCHQNKHYQLRGETRNEKGQFCRLIPKELEDEIINAELSGKAKPDENKAC